MANYVTKVIVIVIESNNNEKKDECSNEKKKNEREKKPTILPIFHIMPYEDPIAISTMTTKLMQREKRNVTRLSQYRTMCVCVYSVFRFDGVKF